MKKFLWFLLEGLNLSQFGGISPQVRVVLQAEAPLDDLFVQEHHDDHDHHDTHVLLDDLGISRVIYKLFAIQVLWELNKEPFFCCKLKVWELRMFRFVMVGGVCLIVMKIKCSTNTAK